MPTGARVDSQREHVMSHSFTANLTHFKGASHSYVQNKVGISGIMNKLIVISLILAPISLFSIVSG